MEKHLNFEALKRPDMPSSPAAAKSSTPTAPRRSLVAALCATAIGLFIKLVPLGAGLAVFFDPLLKRRGTAPGQRPFLRVASLSAIPEDGTPVQFPVVADLTDAWNREPNQPIGAVYLRRVGDKVECFNAICPHAGCFVAYAAQRQVFQCPCHTSSFELSGQRILPSPSPRDLDKLVVDEEKLKSGEVWVQFVNYYPGKEHREEKPS
jgi:menaquinol-cytochrome c reductase iron-sulfur subunit